MSANRRPAPGRARARRARVALLGLEVAVDDVHVRAREERERLENLLRKLADEIEGDPVKLRVLQELIKIVAARVVADQQTAKSA